MLVLLAAFIAKAGLIFPLQNFLAVLSIKIHSVMKHGTSDLISSPVAVFTSFPQN